VCEERWIHNRSFFGHSSQILGYNTEKTNLKHPTKTKETQTTKQTLFKSPIITSGQQLDWVYSKKKNNSSQSQQGATEQEANGTTVLHRELNALQRP